MIDYEKLGVFYLGRTLDPAAPLLYPSKQLTTHAVVLGMTGSGKTGLSIGVLEEAAIDGIPCIALDPKGDLGNLLLTFPELRPEDFQPWVDPEEAARKGIDVDTFAAQAAESWKKGLAEWDQPPARIQRLKDAVDVAIYTPGSNAGRPLALLRSFDAPKAEMDAEALADRISGAVSGLLGLLGIDADPMRSREHILLSRILHDAWSEPRDVDLAGLVATIQKPAFTRVGVVDLESFYPEKDRFAFAMQLNNLLASPAAAAWMEGEPLDIRALLYTPEGKPRISVVSVAHLSDAQRMFFVATLLHELVGWMRAQSGTSSLRALLFMDEIYGYFPPTANPPTKTPMLTLLKQARAFGLGVVLATQNPVDLDYKGLANCGTWFIGRLQTERDKLRVLDGLEGAAGPQGFDRGQFDRLLSGLAPRTFLLHTVHGGAPAVFQTRWTLSYLRGPVTREEIKRLSKAIPKPPPRVIAASAKPALPKGVEERYSGGGSTYEAFVHALARVHYVDTKAGIDAWEDVSVMAPLTDDERLIDWSQAGPVADVKKTPNAGATYGELPSNIARAGDWKKSFAAWIHQDRAAEVLKCEALKLGSMPGESEGDFRVRMDQALREHRDEQVEALKKKLQPKLDALDQKLKKAEARLAKEKSQATTATVSTAVTWGSALIGALFGSRSVSSSVSKVASAARTTGRTMDQHSDVTQVEQEIKDLQAAEYELEAQLQAEIERIGAETPTITRARLPARKADTQVLGVALLWKSVDG